MDRQHPAIQLARALRAADHAGLLDITEDRHITRPLPRQRRDAVQRITALEYLQVTRLQAQCAHQTGVAVQHRLHAGIVFVGRCAQVRTVFKVAATLGVLQRQRDSEVVGIEMPRKAVAGLGQIDDHVSQRVGVRKKARRLQRLLDERREGVPVVDRPQNAVGAKMVGRHKRVGTLIKAAQRVVGCQFRPVLREIGVGTAEVAVAVLCHTVTLLHQSSQPVGAHETLQYGATVGLQFGAQAVQQGVPRRARCVDGITHCIHMVGGDGMHVCFSWCGDVGQRVGA